MPSLSQTLQPLRHELYLIQFAPRQVFVNLCLFVQQLVYGLLMT